MGGGLMYLLCVDCWRAWYAGPGEPRCCDICGVEAVVCSPWTSTDAWQWYQIRIRDKSQGIAEVVTTATKHKRRVLAQAARARGREMYLARAA